MLRVLYCESYCCECCVYCLCVGGTPGSQTLLPLAHHWHCDLLRLAREALFPAANGRWPRTLELDVCKGSDVKPVP